MYENTSVGYLIPALFGNLFLYDVFEENQYQEDNDEPNPLQLILNDSILLH
jgi:uncharacterized protein (DUF952 family)